MRRIYTFICAGIISWTGYTAYAQPQEGIDSLLQSLTEPGSTISVSNIVGNVTGALMEAMETSGPQVSAIDAPLAIQTAIPEINQTIAEILIGDERTGRYPPRLRIDFTEFPLRSLAATNGANNETGGNGTGSRRNGSSTELIVQRVQSRLRLPEVHLEVEGRTATVSGMVETERQRRLVESMLRFEPGIDAVKNEMTVSSDAVTQ